MRVMLLIVLYHQINLGAFELGMGDKIPCNATDEVPGD